MISTIHPGRLARAGSLGVLMAALAAIAIPSLPGCSSSGAHAVDESRAREALGAALDSWKRGEAPTSVASMTVQDADWERGAKLLDYEIQGDGQPRGANLSIRARLTLAGERAGSKKLEKTVSYLVGTSPSVTVFRDMLKR
ncbi:MAG: hypothetical protein U0790_13615 [Isosphaeraceae bacterium]